MPNVFTEARPKGRTEGSPIKGYVVEDHADDELGEFETQDEAIKMGQVGRSRPARGPCSAPQ